MIGAAQARDALRAGEGIDTGGVRATSLVRAPDIQRTGRGMDHAQPGMQFQHDAGMLGRRDARKHGCAHRLPVGGNHGLLAGALQRSYVGEIPMRRRG